MLELEVIHWRPVASVERLPLRSIPLMLDRQRGITGADWCRVAEALLIVDAVPPESDESWPMQVYENRRLVGEYLVGRHTGGEINGMA